MLIPSDSVQPHAAAYIDEPLKFLFVATVLLVRFFLPVLQWEISIFLSLSIFSLAGCFKAYARRIDRENDHHTCSILWFWLFLNFCRSFSTLLLSMPFAELNDDQCRTIDPALLRRCRAACMVRWSARLIYGFYNRFARAPAWIRRIGTHLNYVGV